MSRIGFYSASVVGSEKKMLCKTVMMRKENVMYTVKDGCMFLNKCPSKACLVIIYTTHTTSGNWAQQNFAGTTCVSGGRQTDRQTERQTETDRQTDRQTDR